MITITLSTPDSTIDSFTLDNPNELDALRQAILLGLDFADDLGLETEGARLFARLLRDHC